MNCPVCSAQIQDSFGLIECAKCQNVLFVDFDGSLKVQSDSEIKENPAVEEKEKSFVAEVSQDAPSENFFDPIAAEPPPAATGPLAEVLEFAQSEDSKLLDGALIYNLSIKNADTTEIRDEVLEILKDKKLNLDLKKIKFQMDKMEIKDLNPVKASVIVTRIKHLPIDISWEQRSLIQSGATDE